MASEDGIEMTLLTGKSFVHFKMGLQVYESKIRSQSGDLVEKGPEPVFLHAGFSGEQHVQFLFLPDNVLTHGSGPVLHF
jgi:hypothetical protein